jgi:hypothetical protein
MLSDRERETLDEIQHRLAIEDPQFAGFFHLETRRLAAHGRGFPQAALIVLIVISLMLSVLMIVVHALGPTLFFTGVAWSLVWLRRTDPTRGGRQGL